LTDSADLADKLKALSRVSIKGSIRDADNRVDSTLNGRVTLVINDATRQIRIPTFNWSYRAVEV